MTQPIDQLVSIILPVRNAETTLRACLESLLAQTYTHFEIIAIDDKSRDKTFSILKEYRRRDKRLIISRNVKQYGLTITLNRAVKKAKGSYIAFMNQKDICTPDKLKRQVHYLRRHSKVVALGTQTTFIDSSGRQLTKSSFPTDHEHISRTFLTSDALQLESMLINRYLLPRDLLKFGTERYPVLYRSLIAKMLPYGSLANVNQNLYLRTREEGHIDSMKAKAMHHLVLWMKARFIYGTGISWNSLLYPLNNKLKSTI